MSIDLTAVGGPIFASRSRVNTDSRDYGVFTATSMQALLARIVDGDPESYWHDGTSDDTVTEVVDVSFQNRSAETSLEFDIISLQNINLKNFLLEYSNNEGVSFATVPGFDYQVGTADNAAADLIKTFSPIAASRLRLTMYKTIIADSAKRFGGLQPLLSSVQLVYGGMDKYDRKDREAIRSVTTGDGTRTDEVTRRSAVNYNHWAAAFELGQVPKSERDSIKTIKGAGRPFTFIPQPYDVPRDVFPVLFKGAWAEKFTSKFTGAGYDLAFNLEESGYL